MGRYSLEGMEIWDFEMDGFDGLNIYFAMSLLKYFVRKLKIVLFLIIGFHMK
jgi:hypothetical protein